MYSNITTYTISPLPLVCKEMHTKTLTVRLVGEYAGVCWCMCVHTCEKTRQWNSIRAGSCRFRVAIQRRCSAEKSEVTVHFRCWQYLSLSLACSLAAHPANSNCTSNHYCGSRVEAGPYPLSSDSTLQGPIPRAALICVRQDLWFGVMPKIFNCL